MKISVMSPIYKGELMLDELVKRIKSSVEQITQDYEIVLVNDCSPDNSWHKILDLCKGDFHVKGVNLSRNFGQHYAIKAGLSCVSGDWVVVMDCDLQDQPEEIPHLYNKAQEGYDTVFAQRVVRKDGFWKRLSSTVFNMAFAFLTDQSQDKTTANFGIYRKKVIDSVLSMGDAILCFPPMALWVGYNIAYLPVKHAPRAEGKSSYTLKKLLSFAFDNMIAFSNKPLRLMLWFGLYSFVVSFAIAIFYLIRYMTGGIAVGGFTTIVISLWLIASVLIMQIGMIGVYIGKIFDKVKNRPVFIIKDKVNFES